MATAQASKTGTVSQSRSKTGNERCTFDGGQAARKYGDIPTGDRLTYPHGSKMDRLYAHTPKPDGLVPTPFLPIWPELAVDTKIPILPAPKNMFEIHRGEVGTALHRPVVDYTVTDPLNHEKVVTTPYTALHDPFAKTLFTDPAILTHLKKMELVTADGLVRCRTKAFNEYRRYLNKRLYVADLNATAEKSGQIEALQKEQLKRIRTDVSKSEGKLFKMEQTKLRAKAMHSEKMDALRKRFLLTNAYTDFRFRAHVQMQSEARGNRMLESIAKESQMKAKVALVREAEELRKRFLVQQILEKERRTSAYRQAEKCRKAREHEEFLIDWLSVRCEAQKQQMEKAAETKKVVAATLKRNAMRRQLKVDADRASMVERIEARAAEEERIWGLVRKYFYRWLDNVRMRKARRPDEFHRSFWQVQAEMETAVTFLRQESGYEKFDDFIMNIVKLKRDIMAEMESEDQAEAAAALGLGRYDNEEGDEEDRSEEALPVMAGQKGSTVAPPSAAGTAAPPTAAASVVPSAAAVPDSDAEEGE